MIWWCLLWIPTSQICLHFAFSVCAFLDFFSMISALGLTGKSSSGNQEVWLVVKAQWLSYLNDLVISTLNLEFLDCSFASTFRWSSMRAFLKLLLRCFVLGLVMWDGCWRLEAVAILLLVIPLDLIIYLHLFVC